MTVEERVNKLEWELTEVKRRNRLLLILAMVGIVLFSPAICFGQGEPKADTDAVLQDQPISISAQKPKLEPFSFRGITFGTGVDEISGLVPCGNPPLLPDLPNTGPLVWYVRENEKPINDVEVAVRFGFYKGKLIKIVITGPTVAGFIGGAHQRIDEALNIKYGNPQPAKDICKKNVANLWERSVLNIYDPERMHRVRYGFQAMTVGAWIEAFPVTPPPRYTTLTSTHWWLFDERVLMASVIPRVGYEGADRIEIKDVPLLVGAMNAEAQALQDQKAKDLILKKNAATQSANGDF